MKKLGVNIDHVATLRQARREIEPDPIEAARMCERAGANSIVCHLREDRRHIHDQDVRQLKKAIKTHLTLELSLNKEIIDIALSINPHTAMFVPERRQEITTEGGLDVVKYYRRIKHTTALLKKKNIAVSLFIDASKKQIDHSILAGADIVELHTGPYAHAQTKHSQSRQLKKLKDMALYAKGLGLSVSAGHGLKYHNTKPVAKINDIEELNIGHSIISRSIFVGLENAVKEMKRLLQ